MSLLPESPLTFSPALAATIGLEEAILLSLLGEVLRHHQARQHNGFDWVEASAGQLRRLAPFWDGRAIQRIAGNLRDQGIILVASPPFASSGQLRFAINQQAPSQAPAAQPDTRPRSAGVIAGHWQPDNELLRQLAQYNIPREFALQQVPEFVTYWRERGEPQQSWGSKFIKKVLHLWREQQSADSRKSREAPMTPDWRPSPDALDILTRQTGISGNFVEDAIPEFVLYWRERGERSDTWNSIFIAHIKRQWARFTAVIQNDAEPRPIAADWRPDETVYEVLLLAKIDRRFAEAQIAEFVLYWKDSGRVERESSWNARFLQRVKYQWARRSALPTDASNNHERQQRPDQSGSSRNRSVVQQLTDRSWAD